MSQCSIDPPRFVVWLSKKNRTYRIACGGSILGVHLLRDDDLPLAEHFGSKTADEGVDKLVAVDWEPGPDGVPVVNGCDWFGGRMLQRIDTGGDHEGFVLEPSTGGSSAPARRSSGSSARSTSRPVIRRKGRRYTMCEHAPMCRASVIRFVGAGALALVVAITGWSPASAAQDGTSAFCDARMELEQALLAGGHEAAHEHAGGESNGHGLRAPAHGDEDHGSAKKDGGGKADAKALGDAAHALEEAAPAAVKDDAATLHEALEQDGVGALEQRKVAAAKQRIDELVVESCGFAALKVALVDYGFRNLPENALAAGPVAFEITNAAPEEDHELVVLRVDGDAPRSAKQVLGLSKKKLNKATEVVASAFAAPHGTAVALADLEPGRYLAYCNVPTKGGKSTPHWRKGMYAELEVV